VWLFKMSKRKGINAERELIHLFWSAGWAAVRVAGSGSSKYPSPDILASNNFRKVSIECKVCNSDKKYFLDQEIDQLKEFSDLFCSETWGSIRFLGEPWLFLNVEDLEKTNKGFVASVHVAKSRGLLFDEFVSSSKK